MLEALDAGPQPVIRDQLAALAARIEAVETADRTGRRLVQRVAELGARLEAVEHYHPAVVRPLGEVLQEASGVIGYLQDAADSRREHVRLAAFAEHLVRLAHEVQTTLRLCPDIGR